MHQSPEPQQNPHFRPTLNGCVGKDPRLARAIEESYLEKLGAVAAYTYRSLMVDPIDHALSDLLDHFAVEEMEHFRLLGELISALGGNPTIRTQVRVNPLERQGETNHSQKALSCMIMDSIREEKIKIDRLQTLMGHTADRVVRSLLSYIIGDDQRHLHRLQSALNQ